MRPTRRRIGRDTELFALLDAITGLLDWDSRECAPGTLEACATHAWPDEDAGECPYTLARRVLERYRPMLEARRRQRAEGARKALLGMLDDVAARGRKGGYTAGNVTVAEMGPVPEVLTRPGIGFVEAHADPDLLNWRDTRKGRRERARWEAERDAAQRYGGQHSPWGVTRPPLVTTRQETPPPATHVPD